MRKLFLWFYCQPISDAVVLIILATVIFLLLRERFGNTPYWKVGIPILFLCWITVILFGTLGALIGAITCGTSIKLHKE